MSSQIFVVNLFIICFAAISRGMDANAPLYLLDKRIYEEVTEPDGGIVGRGDLLLKELIAYYCNLYDVFNYLKRKNKKGLAMMDELKKEGGPQVPKMDVDGNVIKEAYKWKDTELEILTTMLGSIRNLWHKVTDKMYELSSSDDTKWVLEQL